MDIKNYLITAFYLAILVFASCALAEQEKSKPMPWQQVQKEVGALYALETNYFASMCYFIRKGCKFDGIEYVLIEGDTDEEIIGQVVHIKGHLAHDVRLIGQGQLIVAGDVLPDVTIYSDDISNVFIAGNLRGAISSTSSIYLVVNKDFTGSFATGSPSSHIVIRGDYNGEIKPILEGGLLYISVLGYTDKAKLMELFRRGYTNVEAYFGTSNHEPGLHEHRERTIDYYTVQQQRNK